MTARDEVVLHSLLVGDGYWSFSGEGVQEIDVPVNVGAHEVVKGRPLPKAANCDMVTMSLLLQVADGATEWRCRKAPADIKSAALTGGGHGRAVQVILRALQV